MLFLFIFAKNTHTIMRRVIKMMNFIIITLAVALGIILSMAVMLLLALRPAVWKAYAKLINKQMEVMIESMDETKDL